MSEETKWRFPGNGGVKVAGLDTGDLQTFMRDSMAALAREICQNSVDAKNPDAKGPVVVEFNSFQLDPSFIPGRDALAGEIKRCLEYWSENPKTYTRLINMAAAMQTSKVTCLRISDFGTTGLVGVSDFASQKSPWYSLIHGSGMSEKQGMTGGSKGIGKYATFVNSAFRTVFYSTTTINHEVGYEGIAYLCSSKLETPTVPNELTQGIGCFGADAGNNPVLEKLDLDPSFHERDDGKPGTDIYILGFLDSGDWKQDIVSKVLESFMAAVVFGSLEVRVDDIVVNKDTIKQIVFSDKINERMRKSIVSQYILLSGDPGVKHDRFSIELDGTILGDCDLYLKEFEGEDQQYATNNCAMIRYPYILIKDLPNIVNSSMPCSAMCIIGDNQLAALLKDTENPQHNAWEFNRISDLAERSQVLGVYKDLVKKIKDTIFDHLLSTPNKKTDVVGAGEYLPEVDDEPGKGEPHTEITDKPVLTETKNKVKTTELNANDEDEEGNGVEIEIEEPGDADSIEHPNGGNNGGGGDPRPGEGVGGGQPGDEGAPTFKRIPYKGTSYRFLCLNKKEGKYLLIFNGPSNDEDARLEIAKLDEGGNRYPVHILSCGVNGIPASIEDNGMTVKISLELGKKIRIEMKTDQTELFSAEVHLYALR
jgi:hypothetical protein